MDVNHVGRLATLARLELTADERTRFAQDLERIVAAADVLRGLDLDGVSPWVCGSWVCGATARGPQVSRPASSSTVAAEMLPPETLLRETLLRSDIPEPGLPRAVALANAPRHTEDGFLVPRVIGGDQA